MKKPLSRSLPRQSAVTTPRTVTVWPTIGLAAPGPCTLVIAVSGAVAAGSEHGGSLWPGLLDKASARPSACSAIPAPSSPPPQAASATASSVAVKIELGIRRMVCSPERLVSTRQACNVRRRV